MVLGSHGVTKPGLHLERKQGVVVEGTDRAIWKETEAPLSTPGRLAGPPAAHNRFCGNPPPCPLSRQKTLQEPAGLCFLRRSVRIVYVKRAHDRKKPTTLSLWAH